MRLIGLDPGLRLTGWGVIDVDGNRLRHVAHGVVKVAGDRPLAERLAELFEATAAVVAAQQPLEAAVEETFVKINPGSTLKLGQARGVVMLAPARAGLPVFEYAANLVKKSVTGAGHADKRQIAMMVGRLLPGVEATADAADALAVAICHAHHRATAKRVEAAL
jgi:crossover junction endodeoxyribonuclease RuvC